MGMHSSNSKKPKGRHSLGLSGSNPGQGSSDSTPTKLNKQEKYRLDGTNRVQGKAKNARRGDRRDTQPQK